jgi:hypothetical protein
MSESSKKLLRKPDPLGPVHDLLHLGEAGRLVAGGEHQVEIPRRPLLLNGGQPEAVGDVPRVVALLPFAAHRRSRNSDEEVDRRG